MVAIDHGHGRDASDEFCQRCRFVEELTAYLDRAANGCFDDWADSGERLLEHVRSASQALARLHPAFLGETGNDGDCVEQAAVTLVQLLDTLNDLRERVIAESSRRN